MLGKLMKYEMKNGLKLMPVVYLGAVVLFLLCWLFKVLNLAPMMATFMLLLVLAAIACVLVPVIYILVRYHKGVFGAEGYLTNTLPVTEGQILASRGITGFIWLILGYGVCFLSIAGLLFAVGEVNLFEFVSTAMEQFWPMAVYLLVVIVFQTILQLGVIYFSITLANTGPFSKNNVLFSVLLYFVCSTVMSFVEMAGMLLVPVGIKMTGPGEFELVGQNMLNAFMDSFGSSASTSLAPDVVIGLGSVVVDILFALGLFIGAWQLLKRKAIVK